jgi:hypothetical protein
MSTGNNINETIMVNGKIEDVFQKVLVGFNGISGFQVNAFSPNSITITRKFRPTWVWVVAVIGIFFFLIGLLALFYTETETISIHFVGENKRTRINIGGVGTPEVVTRLNNSVASFQKVES